MRKPKLPANPIRDTKAQRRSRLKYIFWLVTEGYPIDHACKKAGVTRSAFYMWVNKNADTMAEYEQTQLVLHEKIGELAKLCALKAFKDPRYQSSLQFYLRCRAGWNDGQTNYGQQVMPSINFKPKAAEELQPAHVDKVKG